MKYAIAALGAALSMALAAPAGAQAFNINDPKLDEAYCVHDMLRDDHGLVGLDSFVDEFEAANWEEHQLTPALARCSGIFKWSDDQKARALAIAETGGIHDRMIRDIVKYDTEGDYSSAHIATIPAVTAMLTTADAVRIGKTTDDIFTEKALIARFRAALIAAGGPKSDEYFADEVLEIVHYAIVEQRLVKEWLAKYPPKANAPKIVRDPKRGYDLLTFSKPEDCVWLTLENAKGSVGVDIAKDYLGGPKSTVLRDAFLAVGRECSKTFGWTNEAQQAAQAIGLQALTAHYLESQIKARGADHNWFRNMWRNELSYDDRVAFTGDWSRNSDVIARVEAMLDKKIPEAKFTGGRQVLFSYFEALSMMGEARASFPTRKVRRPLPDLS